MDYKQSVLNMWNDINNQNWGELSLYFSEAAVINWHNTNECFSVREFVLANSKYPGKWLIEVEKLLETENIVISVVKVILEDSNISFHATSFFQFLDAKITVLDEYWGDDSQPPQWRVDMGIGKSIANGPL